MMGGAERTDGFSDINVTPLVDVMLVLLVIFMITAPLLTAGLRVDLPEENAPAAPLKDDSALVSITADGTIVLDGHEIGEDVEGALRADHRVRESGELYVEADAEARYTDVARVVSAARAVGIDGLNLLVQPRDGVAR
jgi:biopolymer transport protein TolR